MNNTKTSLVHRFKKFWRYGQLYILLLPAIIVTFIFKYIPIYGVQIAFRDYSPRLGIWRSEWVGLKYMKEFVAHPNFIKYMINTLRITLYGLCVFPCPIIFALMLNEVKNLKFKKTVQMISYMPNFLSMVVVCGMIKLFFSQSGGVINTIIEMFGGSRMEFLTIPQYFEDIYVWSGVWQGLGWESILYLSALSGVSLELIDAAKIDGATRLQVIRYVNIPAITPTITIMLIYAVGGILGVGFEKIFLLQNDLNLSRSQVISTYVYKIGMQGGEFSRSSAIGLFMTVISLIMLSIVNQIIKKLDGATLW